MPPPVLLGFMFSAEFQQFMDAAVGSTPQRSEVALVMDSYRGFLARLPDTAGLQYWRGRLRSAQCQGAGAVNAAAIDLIIGFEQSPDYGNRARSDRQFIADSYDVYFRRAPDVGGFNYWADQVSSGARTRLQVIYAFFGTAEWSNRVTQTAAEACIP